MLRGRTEQILLANCLPCKTIAATMMLYKYTKVKIRSLYRDTYFFDTVACVLQKDNQIYDHNLPRLSTSKFDRSNERKWLDIKKKKVRSRRYPAETITDTD